MQVSGQIHASAALPPGKEPLVPNGQETLKNYSVTCRWLLCVPRYYYFQAEPPLIYTLLSELDQQSFK
jgi:hypothetical protein